LIREKGKRFIVSLHGLLGPRGEPAEDGSAQGGNPFDDWGERKREKGGKRLRKVGRKGVKGSAFGWFQERFLCREADEISLGGEVSIEGYSRGQEVVTYCKRQGAGPSTTPGLICVP